MKSQISYRKSNRLYVDGKELFIHQAFKLEVKTKTLMNLTNIKRNQMKSRISQQINRCKQ